MMDINEVKQQIKKNVKWDSERTRITGGQSCGMPAYPVILISEEMNMKITMGYHRSQLKNKELAFALFELALDELVR
jgi:protein subunit release factor A